MDYRDESPAILRDYLTYHETIKGHSRATVDEYYLDLRNFFRFLKIERGVVPRSTELDEISIVDVDLDFVSKVTLAEVYAYLAFLSRDKAKFTRARSEEFGLNAASRARKVSSIRGFYKYLTVKAKLLSDNPIQDLDSPKAKRSLPRYLTLEESQRLLQSVDGTHKERDYCILCIFLNCGLRISEIAGLNISDVRTDHLRVLGKGDVNTRNLQLYDQMLSLYPQDVILIAAQECGHSGKDADDTLKLLQAWKEKGLETRTEVEEYVKAFHEKTALIRELRKLWGTDESRVGKTDRSMVYKWENELGFSRETILAAASYASEARQPMAYLDRILNEYKEKGIITPEQVRLERGQKKNAASGTVKRNKVSAQEYEQRDYGDVQEQMMEEQNRRILERLHADGGLSDA